MNRWLHAVALLAVSAALAAGGCGEDDGSTAAGGGEGTQAEAAPVESKPEKKKPKITVVNSSGVPGVGMTLLNSRWFVLYEFSRDKGKKSACYGACAKEWPPLLTNGRKNLYVGAGASEVSLGTTKRKGGAIQVTYAGHPVYSYTGDVRRWHAKGEGIRAHGGVFHGLVDPNFE
jgi:predicted lipoprotein with Yx(FWY)xxD motif